MPVRGPQRYPIQVIRGAIQKMEDGVSMSDIARELGIAKSTVSYWFTNAHKFTNKTFEEGIHPRISRIQNQITEHGWKLYFKIIKKLNSKIDDASFRDLIYGASELQNRLLQLRPMNGSGNSSMQEIEVSEETRVTVRRFLEKQKERKKNIVEEKDGEMDLATPPPEQSHSPENGINKELTPDGAGGPNEANE